MKPASLILFSLFLAAPVLPAHAADPTAGYRCLVSGCGAGAISILAKDGSIQWQYPLATESSDCWQLPNGNLFFSFKAGAREVRPDKSTVWEYLAPAGTEVQGCQPLGENLFLVAEAHPDGFTFLYEMDRSKTVSKTLRLNLGGTAHQQHRQVRKTPQGTYLLCQQRSGGKALEFDAAGTLVRTFPSGRFGAERLANGNTLIGCGDEHRVIEVDPQNQVVWELAQKDVPGNILGFAAAAVRLANGNTLVCNWAGHGGVPGDQPVVFEVTPKKELVWELKQPGIKLISSIQILSETNESAQKPVAAPPAEGSVRGQD